MRWDRYDPRVCQNKNLFDQCVVSLMKERLMLEETDSTGAEWVGVRLATLTCGCPAGIDAGVSFSVYPGCPAGAYAAGVGSGL